jgi:hypothetical protein
MRRIIATLFMMAAGVAYAAPAGYPVTINSQAARAPDLIGFRSNEQVFRVTFTDGNTESDIGSQTPFMNWFVSPTSTTYVASSYSVIGATTGLVDFTFSSTNMNYAAGKYYYEAGLQTAGGANSVYRQGRFTIKGSPTGTGVGGAVFTSNLNWASFSSYSNTITNGPTRFAGAGVVVTLNGDGSQLATIAGDTTVTNFVTVSGDAGLTAITSGVTTTIGLTTSALDSAGMATDADVTAATNTLAAATGLEQVLNVSTNGGGNDIGGVSNITCTGTMRPSKIVADAVVVSSGSDSVDVSAANSVFLNTASGSITIGAFVGGVEGQVICVVRGSSINSATLEHNEGTGNQNIFLYAGADQTITGYGGWWLFCDGSNWRECNNDTVTPLGLSDVLNVSTNGGGNDIGAVSNITATGTITGEDVTANDLASVGRLFCSGTSTFDTEISANDGIAMDGTVIRECLRVDTVALSNSSPVEVYTTAVSGQDIMNYQTTTQLVTAATNTLAGDIDLQTVVDNGNTAVKTNDTVATFTSPNVAGTLQFQAALGDQFMSSEFDSAGTFTYGAPASEPTTAVDLATTNNAVYIYRGNIHMANQAGNIIMDSGYVDTAGLSNSSPVEVYTTAVAGDDIMDYETTESLIQTATNAIGLAHVLSVSTNAAGQDMGNLGDVTVTGTLTVGDSTLTSAGTFMTASQNFVVNAISIAKSYFLCQTSQPRVRMDDTSTGNDPWDIFVESDDFSLLQGVNEAGGGYLNRYVISGNSDEGHTFYATNGTTVFAKMSTDGFETLYTNAAGASIDVTGGLELNESSEPADPADGKCILWFSNGTGAGNDGDLMLKKTVGGVVTTNSIDITAL